MAGVLHQQTLRETAKFSGIGLHSGNRVAMTFLPAAPNSGIRFRRADLDGKPEIEARVENVSDTNRSTTLSSPDVPATTTSRANTSASITTAPSSVSRRATVLLPAPIPPVKPTLCIPGALSWRWARAQGWLAH